MAFLVKHHDFCSLCSAVVEYFTVVPGLPMESLKIASLTVKEKDITCRDPDLLWILTRFFLQSEK